MTEIKQIVIEREFNAPRELVWKAWTDPEMLKKWWGPEGFTAPSITVDLRVGGKYVFAMQGEPGTPWEKVSYSGGIYREIVPNEKLVVTDYFSDEDGNIKSAADYGLDPNFPKENEVTILFEDLPAGRQGVAEGKTKVSVMYQKPETEAQMEAMLKSRMEEGWQSSLNKLEASLQV